MRTQTESSTAPGSALGGVAIVSTGDHQRAGLVDEHLLEGVSWSDYQEFVRLRARHRKRLTYDHGTLEIKSPLYKHERLKGVLAWFVEILAEELDRPFEMVGSTTLTSEQIARGVEPDECYYLDAGTAAIRGKESLDLTRDPAPDLVIEIDLTSSVLPRLPIYAALGVKEVWRYASEAVVFLRLSEDAQYRADVQSGPFPGLSSEDVTRWVARAIEIGQNEWRKEVRRWIRENLVHRPGEEGSER